MAKRRSRRQVTQHAAGTPKTEQLLHFIELDGFVDDWKRLRLTDGDLVDLEMTLMAGWRKAPVVEKTGGLRKLRFAPKHWNVGKRGAIRVCFKCFEEFGIVLLIVAYGKNERDDLSETAKADIRQFIREAEQEIRRRKGIV